MAQCERIRQDGERCSNQALPGRLTCASHSTGEETLFTIKAVPSSLGQKPVFPGLRADQHHRLVARRGAIHLAAGPNREALLFTRLVRALSLLSQSVDLPCCVRLLQRRQSEDGLILLKPPALGVRQLSAFFDVAAAAARLADGQLYIGRSDALVRYRDDRAPRGYDVPEFQAPAIDRAILLVDRWGGCLLRRNEFIPIRLAEFCLRVAPVQENACSLPQELYVLAPRALYGIVGRYLRAHQLFYRVAVVEAATSRRLLFKISRQSHAPASLPRFVVDYLSRLPRVVPLVAASPSESPRFLIQWQHRYPLALPHVAAAFADDELIVLSAAPGDPMSIRPAPVFVDGDLLTTGYVPQPLPLRIRGAAVDKLPDLRVPILLRPDNGSLPPVAALFLNPSELSWLRRLLFRLPGDAFGTYTFWRGDNGALLVGGDRAVEGIPFGLPLRQLAGTNLFIPLRQRLIPLLPRDLLIQAFDLRDDCYTILMEDHRLELPKSGFVSLARAALAEPCRPRVEIRLIPPAILPELSWRPAAAYVADAEVEKPVLAPAAETSAKPVPAEPVSVDAIGGDFKLDALLRNQAKSYEEADDFLAATVCYSLLKDEANRARCYLRSFTPSSLERR